MRLRESLSFVALAALAVGCGGGGETPPPPPVPGTLNLVLNTPNANDGAIMLKVTGAEVDSAAAAGTSQTAKFTIQATFTRIVAAGNLTDGVIAKIWVPDVNNHSAYSVQVEQAAARTTFTQQTLTSYSVSVTP